MNVIPRAQCKASTSVTRKPVPVTEFRGVRPNMEENTVDPVIKLLNITATFRNANVSVHQKTRLKIFQFYRLHHK